MNGRNRDNGFGKGFAKLGLGMGIGFALYMMFGGRGGLGFGRGSGGLNAGRGEGPGTAPDASSTTQQAPDAQPLSARIVPDPSNASKAVIDLEGNLVGIADLIARVITGGRRDVVIIVRGDTRHGAAQAIEQAITSAGIEIIRPQTSTVTAPTTPRDPWA